MLSPRTERDYRQVVERWTRDGQPDPETWVGERSSEATKRNARAALIWHFRVNLGRTLDIPWVRPLHRPVPSAFSVAELAAIREAAIGVHHPRCRPVVDLLYSTGARLAEVCAITLEDVSETHIILRNTKRRPGGLQVHRATSADDTGIAFGDSVRIVATPLTESLGFAGRVGTCFGFTTPSVTGVDVIGGRATDLAFNVHFDGDDVEDAWFSPELVESLGPTVGMTASIGEHHYVITEDGQWVEVDDEPPLAP